ncbi:MAG TPA: nucleotidyltransferase family protein [Gammaproteobacteria bacterium]|nr:nucleotidyltransferase family protein [Gammaproteobacteria bacterium]
MTHAAEQPDETVRRLLTSVVRSPELLATLRPAELDLVLRLARRVRLLGRFAERLARRGLLEGLPEPAREQLTSAFVVVEARARITRWELDRLTRALRGVTSTPAVVLKGCAYLLAELPNAAGRVFADVDLLFPEAALADAERALLVHGWRGAKLEPYDQRYYRLWTHELPPLVHAEREVEADLHHNIVPRVGRLKPSAARLLEAAQPVPGQPWRRLDDRDLVLHAMTHLMFDSDLADCLRDLVDIDDLLRHFAAATPKFWERLWARACELDLGRPAFYALRHAHRWLGTPVPEALLQRSRERAPPGIVVWLMDRLVPWALFPAHPDRPQRRVAVARALLYVRSLWIRMPPLLLARHLGYQWYRRRIRPKLRPAQ